MLRFFRSSDKDGQTDAELVQKFAEGGKNTHVLGVLYERYMPLLYGICLKYLKDPMHAEDAVIQIYEQVERKLAESDVQNFKAWVCTVARNHCLMALRKNSNIHIEHVDPLESWQFETLDLGSDDVQEREALLLRLEKCLKDLNDHQRQHVTMFYLENKSYAEISEHTKTELGAVRSYIQNGKRNLKNCMDHFA